jgi:hypothetical protein
MTGSVSAFRIVTRCIAKKYDTQYNDTRIMTLSIVALSITIKTHTQNKYTQNNDTMCLVLSCWVSHFYCYSECHYNERHYAECRSAKGWGWSAIIGATHMTSSRTGLTFKPVQADCPFFILLSTCGMNTFLINIRLLLQFSDLHHFFILPL